VDPREQFRVAHKDRTCAVLNLHKQPTVYALLGKSDFDPEALKDEIFAHSRVDCSFAKNLSALCEQRLGSKQFVNIMMLGVAFQLGLIPVSAWSIAWAIKDSIRRDHRKNLKAFNIGRKLALEPRALPNKPQPETWEQLVTNKTRILRKTHLRGAMWSERFEKIVNWAMMQMRDLPEDAKYDLALRVYDLMQYQDHALAKRYVELVRSVYRRDSRERNFAATDAAIWNLAKVMLIKDEPYVAYLLTRIEKKQRDIAKFGVDVNNGDRIIYRHHTSPEFNIGKYRVRLRLTTTDWQLRLAARCKWWRKLPGWHRREASWRDWYIGLLDRISLSTEAAYQQALRALKCPEDVSGYREVRYPKMDRVREQIESELTRVPKVEVTVNTDVLNGLRTPTHV
jgi:indolepyruvate ferredoxin oxidoreductase